MTQKHYLWMAVTSDKYELPLVVEESSTLLARKLGVSPNTVLKRAWLYRNGKLKMRGGGRRCTYRIVMVRMDVG